MSSLENVESLKRKQLMLDLLTASQLSKGIAAFSSQLDGKNIIMFFKCMEAYCEFCTDEEGEFENHLSGHVDFTAQCCYCSEVSTTETELVKHMVAVHGSCKFQCARCFYRSRNVTHLRVHTLLKHHSTTVLWYACKEKVALDTNLVRCYKDHVGSYVCMGGCSFKTVCPQRFLQHLSVAHAGSCTFSCHICSEKASSKDSVIMHYAEMHGFCAFHCFYCSFGSQTEWDVIVHVASCHSDKPFKIFLRSQEIPESFIKVEELKPSIHDGSSSNFTSFSADRDPKDGWEESTMNEKPSPHTKVGNEIMAAKNCPSNGVTEDSLTPAAESSEFRCKCGAVFGDVAVFLQHIGENHSQDSAFDCPRCVLFTNGSVNGLFVHIVDCHTVFLRCIYKSCFFFGTSQESIDNHIMQVHQEYELPLENASTTDEGPCSTAGAVAAETGKECIHDTVHDMNNTDMSGEESLFENEDKPVHDAQVTRACNLCSHADMLPLDYFRHMSLGHGVRYFCGHCEKCYKQKKHMVLHYWRCHSGQQFLVRSFENNKVKEITQQAHLDQEDEVQGKRVDTVTTSTAQGTNAARVQSHASNASPLSTAVHYTHPKEGTVLMSCANGNDQDINSKDRSFLERSRNLEPVPLERERITSDKQEQHQGFSDCLGTTTEAHNLFETKRLDQANTQSTVDAQRPHCSKAGVELSSGRNSSERPVEEDKVQQPTNDCWPAYYCGHCLKVYRLLKALMTHQETVHPEQPRAVEKLNISELCDVTNDVMEQNHKDRHTAVGKKSGSSISSPEDVSGGDSDDAVSSCSHIGTPPKRGWRRIVIADSESETEDHTTRPDTQEEGFSYYGKPVEPVDCSNLYIWINDGLCRIAYDQVISVHNLNPVVLVCKEATCRRNACKTIVAE